MGERLPKEQSGVRDHRRQWRRCLYVYPVISRRSKGLSIGVNLNPDKQCNFSCVYCQINRGIHRNLSRVDLAILHDELHLVLAEAVSGKIWSQRRFARTPRGLRRINDIAFSGDGEPTCVGNFDEAVAAAAEALADVGVRGVKLVVITNASNLASRQVQRALPILDASGGEIWAKLDAGTEEYFRRLNRPRPGITLQQIVRGITEVARDRPVVLQSVFVRLDGQEPPESEIQSYCRRVGEIVDGGGKIKLIQVYTIARSPAERYVSALEDERLQALAAQVRAALPTVTVEAYSGEAVWP